MIYLDNAATTMKKPDCVIRAMNKYTKEMSVNAGRGGHRYSVAGLNGIIETADILAELFGIDDSSRIAFTQNATYALNMAIGGTLKHGGHMVVTQMDHNSVLRPASMYGNFTIVKADSSGAVNPDDVEAAIREDTVLVACTHISNVCGTIEPVSRIGEAAHRHGAFFLLDAAQSAGTEEIDVGKMNIDMLAFSGHKGLMAPMGTGGLYVSRDVPLEPIIAGGTGSSSESLSQPREMPDMLHSGTLNTPAIMAMGDSVKFIRKIGIDNIAAKERTLAKLLIDELLNMDGITVYGKKYTGGRNGTVAFNINGRDSGEAAQELSDKYSIAVRGGYHCAPLAHIAIGSRDSGAVRASFGFFNTSADVKSLVNAVVKLRKTG